MSTTFSRRIFYSGRVQGVGFRWSVKQIASGFEVVGWVRNLADGRVELEVTGDASEVTAFLEAVANGHLATHIRQIEQAEVEMSANLPKGFEIKH